ncbi:hypothetical protein NT6N_31680 [Oceaniferula spumae]|uniref:Ice-binding protein C-terminal domain-containing protein n=1 Tax=Oceaniferula spumae TaxID=2979115 RepID=A0AAT9FQA4_9BACT
MKIRRSIFLPAFCAVAMTATTAHAANVIVDGGFEGTLTTDGPPFVGFWEGFSASNATSEFGTTNPRSGSQHLELRMNGFVNEFSGVLQDIVVSPGAEVTYSGWHLEMGTGGSIEIRIEWRDSVGNTEIARTPNLTSTPGPDYEMFSLTETVPAGADTARIVYASQSFGGASDAVVFVDDLTVNVVPEPSSTAIFSLGIVSLLLRRRRA